jgi:hypothetical protein
MTMTWENLTERLIALGVAGFLVLGAIALWIIGRQLIHFAIALAMRVPQVYFDTNRLIREAFGEAGYPAPEQRMRVVQGG